MKTISHVKIKVIDDQERILEHFYIRAKKWDDPAGKVEESEKYTTAAKRELLERTGYAVEEADLIFAYDEETDGIIFRFFTTEKIKLKQKAKPGELGGYATTIRWIRKS